MARLPDSHTRLLEAERIAQFLMDVGHVDTLHHITRARIWYLRSEREVFLRGTPAAAYICIPKVQGYMTHILEDLVAQAAPFDGEVPDFIVRVDAANWDALSYTEPAKTFWRGRRKPAADDVDWPVGRERLIFHELKHIVQRVDSDGALRFSDEDGRPVLALQPHDAEFFHDELESYGPTVCGAVDTALAIAEGGRQEQAARRPRRLAS